ncbi:MAG: hypothetical protein ABR604_01375 [Jatrophihabitantaceae bacterium]
MLFGTTDSKKAFAAGAASGYCQRVPGAEDVYLAMALLTQSGSDLRASFDRFAKLAGEAWPDAVTVERAGFFSRGAVRKITIRLPGQAFVARAEGLGVQFEIGIFSQGVIIRTDHVQPAMWSAALHDAIARSTVGHLQARQVFDDPSPNPPKE